MNPRHSDPEEEQAFKGRVRTLANLSKFFHIPYSDLKHMTIRELNELIIFMGEYLDEQNTPTVNASTNTTRRGKSDVTEHSYTNDNPRRNLGKTRDSS